MWARRELMELVFTAEIVSGILPSKGKAEVRWDTGITQAFSFKK